MKRLVGGAAVVALLGATLVSAQAADTSGKRIALSNNYAGNSWRQAMLQSWAEAGKIAIAEQAAGRGRYLHDAGQGSDDPGGAGAEPHPAGL